MYCPSSCQVRGSVTDFLCWSTLHNTDQPTNIMFLQFTFPVLTLKKSQYHPVVRKLSGTYGDPVTTYQRKGKSTPFPGIKLRSSSPLLDNDRSVVILLLNKLLFGLCGILTRQIESIGMKFKYAAEVAKIQEIKINQGNSLGHFMYSLIPDDF